MGGVVSSWLAFLMGVLLVLFYLRCLRLLPLLGAPPRVFLRSCGAAVLLKYLLLSLGAGWVFLTFSEPSKVGFYLLGFLLAYWVAWAVFIHVFSRSKG